MNLTSTASSSWIKPIAQTGLIAKGIVYCITGIILLMAAFNWAGTNTGEARSGGVFKTIHEQPFGKILLGIVALGLVCYASWRLFMAIKDTENHGSNFKGIVKRIAYFISGLGYFSLALIAGNLVLNNQNSDGNSRQQYVSELLSKPFGAIAVGVVAAIMFGVGIAQIYKAVSGKYRKYVERANYGTNDTKDIIIKSGQAGYFARGIVWLIIAWLFLKAAMQSNAGEAGDTSKAFKWIETSTYGDVLLAVVAAGLLCYGIFMFLRARYQPIHTS